MAIICRIKNIRARLLLHGLHPKLAAYSQMKSRKKIGITLVVNCGGCRGFSGADAFRPCVLRRHANGGQWNLWSPLSGAKISCGDTSSLLLFSLSPRRHYVSELTFLANRRQNGAIISRDNIKLLQASIYALFSHPTVDFWNSLIVSRSYDVNRKGKKAAL